MGQYISNERMRQLYEEERDKLSPLPDSDSDFIALDNAWKRYQEERLEYPKLGKSCFDPKEME